MQFKAVYLVILDLWSIKGKKNDKIALKRKS